MSEDCDGCRCDPVMAFGERGCAFTTFNWDFLDFVAVCVLPGIQATCGNGWAWNVSMPIGFLQSVPPHSPYAAH